MIDVYKRQRPEIIGIICGAFLIAVVTKEYRSTAGSSPMVRFVLGMIMMIGSLAFLGCPLRMAVSYTHLDVYKRQILYESCDVNLEVDRLLVCLAVFKTVVKG